MAKYPKEVMKIEVLKKIWDKVQSLEIEMEALKKKEKVKAKDGSVDVNAK